MRRSVNKHTVNGGSEGAKFREAVTLIEHVNRHVSKPLGDELDAQSATSIAERQRLGKTSVGIQHMSPIDRVEGGHVRQMRHEQLEDLRACTQRNQRGQWQRTHRQSKTTSSPVTAGIGELWQLVYHPIRATQPGHPSVGRRNEYGQWFRPPLGKIRSVLRSSAACNQHCWHKSVKGAGS